MHRDAFSTLALVVFLEQLGLPIPAVPVLMLAGGLIASPLDAVRLMLAALVPSLCADLIWYGLGRRYGYRLLSGLCRLSINPGSCVSETEARFVRWGVWSLIVGKFVPGFSAVAPPIAGALRMPLLSFTIASGLGCLLWAGLAMAGGALLKPQVDALLAFLGGHARLAVLAVILVLASWLGWKIWQKYRFRQDARMPRISAAELIAAQLSDAPPVVLDLRPAGLRATEASLVGAVAADLDRLRALAARWPHHQAIVTLCACPEDATAIKAARRLIAWGYLSVRPLAGGHEALLAELAQREPAAEASLSRTGS
jgi:membrane protein DedA with SNARE-associated domain/rhodanese-related sulfurtransferase